MGCRSALVVLASASSMLTGGCAGQVSMRGGVVEVTFRSTDPAAQSRVAADCGLSIVWRVSSTQVRYRFTEASADSLACLRRHQIVRAAAQPL